MITVTLNWDARVRSKDERGEWIGSALVPLVFNLPASNQCLLEALRVDAWIIDEPRFGEGQVTIAPDDIGEWEQHQAEFGESDKDCDEIESLVCGRGVEILCQLRGECLDSIELNVDGSLHDFGTDVDALLSKLEELLGPLEPSDAFFSWEAPDKTCAELEILAMTPTVEEVPNAAWRLQIRATGLPWRLRDSKTEVEFVLIPPGDRWMQSSEEPGAQGLRQVKVPAPYYVSAAPITSRQRWLGSGFSADGVDPNQLAVVRPFFANAFGTRTKTRVASNLELEISSATTAAFTPRVLKTKSNAPDNSRVTRSTQDTEVSFYAVIPVQLSVDL